MKYGGVDLTVGGRVTQGNYHLEWWFLPAPAAGAANLVLTPAANTWVSAAVYSISGITSVASFLAALDWASAAGTSTAPSVAIGSRTGDLVLDLVTQQANNQTYAVGAGQSKIYGQDSLANTDVKTASSQEAGAASVTMSWTLGTSGTWAIMAITLPDATVTSTVERASLADIVEAVTPPGTERVSAAGLVEATNPVALERASAARIVVATQSGSSPFRTSSADLVVASVSGQPVLVSKACIVVATRQRGATTYSGGTFEAEIAKLQRVMRAYIRFSSDENPSVTNLGTRLYGKIWDNTGAVPVKGTVTSFGSYPRALANFDQTIETAAIAPELLDPDNEWSMLAATPWNLVNRWMAFGLRMLSDGGSSLDQDILTAQILNPTFPGGHVRLDTRVTLGDYLGTKVPKRLVSTDDWPNADPEARGTAVPIIYGDKSAAARPGIINFTGIAVSPSGQPAIVMNAATAVPGGSGNLTDQGWYYAATPFVGGVATAPISNMVGPVFVDAVNNAIQLDFTVPGSAPDEIQIFRSANPWGQSNVTTIPGVTGSSTYLDASPTEEESPWILNYRYQVYYWLSAIYAGQELPAVGPLLFELAPDNRSGKTISLSWDPVVGATGLVLRRASQLYHFPLGYDREVAISPSSTAFLDDPTITSAVTLPTSFSTPASGALRLLCVDLENFIYRVAGHPCKKIAEVFVTRSADSPPVPVLQVAGVDYTAYTTVKNGNTYQVIQFTTDQGSNLVTANVIGIADIPDSTGNDDGAGTTIVRGIKQFEHFLLNWVFNDWRSGDWYTDTDFRPGLINRASFTAADLESENRAPSGYIGAGALTEQRDVSAVIQDWINSFDLNFFQSLANEFNVSLDPISVASVSGYPSFQPKESIFRKTFECRLETQKMANRIPYVAGPELNGFTFSNEVADTAAQTSYGVSGVPLVLTGPLYTIVWSRDPTTVLSVMSRVLQYFTNPPVKAVFATPLAALTNELGDFVRVTHRYGVSSVSTGWTDRLCKIIRIEVDFDNLLAWVTVSDANAALAVPP